MQTIYLDMSNKGVVPVIYAKQGDVGRKFCAVLTDNGLPYVPAAGSAFSVWYSGASGDGNYTNIGEESAFSVNGNKVAVELVTQMLAVHGEGLLCLILNGADGSQIASWNINYLVESVPGADSEAARSYYTAFSQAVQNLPYPDASLSVAGKAADAAAVGTAIAGITPAQIGAVSKTGDTMSGDLNIQKGIPSVRFDSGAGTAALFKNAAGTNDFGTTLEDVRTDGRKVSLSLNADQSGAEALTLYSSADNASYKVLHTGSKDKILSMTGGYSGTLYADPNGGTTSFNLPDVTETRNYLGIIRGLNPAYTAVYAFCGYQNSHYWAVPIKEHQYIGVSAQNGNTVTVTNNTGHSALYVRMIDMSII